MLVAGFAMAFMTVSGFGLAVLLLDSTLVRLNAFLRNLSIHLCTCAADYSVRLFIAVASLVIA